MCSTKPHAVKSARGNFYSYDANGNLTGGAGRVITWNSANLPTRITQGSAVTDFSYGPDRSRYKQVSTVGGVATTTFYVGKLYEQSTVGIFGVRVKTQVMHLGFYSDPTLR